MTRSRPVLVLLLATVLVGCLPNALEAQAAPLRPVTVGSPMPDFTLPAYQGGEVTLSDLLGKTVVLIFPRGRSGPGSWCHVCNYQHQELVEYEARNALRRRANLEILFVLPYDGEEIDGWIEAYPQQLQDLEDWRSPPDPDNLDAAGRRRMQLAKGYFPRSFTASPETVPGPFPILIDGDRTVSGGLGFFTDEWGGSQVEQNVPTVLIVGSDGVLRFKYISQNTLDRPPLEYLLEVISIVAGTSE